MLGAVSAPKRVYNGRQTVSSSPKFEKDKKNEIFRGPNLELRLLQARPRLCGLRVGVGKYCRRPAWRSRPRSGPSRIESKTFPGFGALWFYIERFGFDGEGLEQPLS